MLAVSLPAFFMPLEWENLPVGYTKNCSLIQYGTLILEIYPVFIVSLAVRVNWLRKHPQMASREDKQANETKQRR